MLKFLNNIKKEFVGFTISIINKIVIGFIV